jgi:hypothetical protein
MENSKIYNRNWAESSRVIMDQATTLVNRVPKPTLFYNDSRAHFLHIPKCGGTTTRYILEAACSVLGAAVANQAGGFLDNAAPARDQEAQFVLSHAPPPDLFDRNDTHYFTVLRNPIERVESLITHISRSPRGRGKSHDEIFQSLTDLEFNQATGLLGWAPESGNFDKMLERAKNRLREKVLFFGFQEKYHEFAALLATFIGFEGIIFSKYQVTDTKCRLLPENRYHLTKRVCHDAELYAYALNLYEKSFASLFKDGSFRKARIGVPYLSVRYDSDTKTVGLDQLVFC